MGDLDCYVEVPAMSALTVFQRYRSELQKATHYPLTLTSLLIEQGALPPAILRQVDERPSEERVVTLFTHICASLACAPNETVAREKMHKCLWAMKRLFPETDELITTLKLSYYERKGKKTEDDSDHEESPDPLDELNDLKISPVTLDQALTDQHRHKGNTDVHAAELRVESTDSVEETMDEDSEKTALENINFPHSDESADLMLADSIAEKHSTSSSNNADEHSLRDDSTAAAEEHSNTLHKEDSLSSVSSTALEEEPQDPDNT